MRSPWMAASRHGEKGCSWEGAGEKEKFIGVVEHVGTEVRHVAKGDFVVSPFAYSDGTCPNCQVGMTTACVNGGFIPAGNGDGGQGERET